MKLKLWEKVDSFFLRNFNEYSKDPLINKYLETNASSSFEGYLIVRKVGKPIWISHPFNYAQAKQVFSKIAIVLNYQKKEDLQKIFKKYTGKRIGFNGAFLSHTSHKAFKKLLKGKKLIDVSNELEFEKSIKTKSEIKRIKKAVTVTNDSINFIRTKLTIGITEKEVVNEFKKYFEARGLETAFCIVAFGKNSSNIHYESSNTKLTNGVPILIDVGAKYEGYCSDLSETFWFGKEEGPKFIEFEKEKQKVINAQHSVEKLLTEGTIAKKLYLEATKHVGKLPHAIWHGIGIEVHDSPNGIGDKANWKLESGMVLAIEPAIYNKEFGIRLENNYVITKKGFEKL